MPDHSSAPLHYTLADDATLLELLQSAHRFYALARGSSAEDYAAFVVDLELEVLRRGLEVDAPEEPPAPVEQIRRLTHRRSTVCRRLEKAARTRDRDAFNRALRHIHPDDVARAWSLVYAFASDWQCVCSLLRQLYFMTVCFRTEDYHCAASALLVSTCGSSTPEQQILELEKVLREDLDLPLPDTSVTAAYARFTAHITARRNGGHNA